MSTHQRVVFVCEHGAAKSVLAAVDFNTLAEARGISARAVARGTAPDPSIAPVVVERLRLEGVDLAASTPQALVGADLEGALRVVTFDQPQVASLVPRHIPLETWNSVPPVSADFDRARQAIRASVQSLVDDLAAREASGSA